MVSLDYSLFARIPKLGAATLCRVGQQLGPPLELIRLAKHEPANLALQLPHAALQALRSFDQARYDADLKILQRQQIAVIGADKTAYPPQLREIPGAPAVLFLLGNGAVLHQPQLAMVGSRHPTANGARTARDVAFHFASQGLAITSSRAVGIGRGQPRRCPCRPRHHHRGLRDGSRPSLPRGPQRACRTHSGTRRSGQRVSASHPADPPAFRVTKSPHQRPRIRRFGSRSAGSQWLAEHLETCWRAGSRGVRRARIHPQPAVAWLPPVAATRRRALGKCRRRFLRDQKTTYESKFF